MSDWAVLDRTDPAPGDVEGTRALGRRLLSQAEMVEQETARLRSLSGSAGDLKMAGDYAAEYTSTLTELPGDLSKLGVAYRGCGNALTRFAEELADAKTRAGQALANGTDADQRYQSAIRDLRLLLPPEQQALTANSLSLTPSAVDAATVKLDENTREQIRHAARRARSADQDLDQAKALADQAAALRSDAENRASRGIGDALEGSGIKNKSWLEKTWDAVSKPFRSWDDFVSLCSAVALIAGTVALFVSGPIGWALMAAALIAGAVMFADSLNKYSKGEVGLGTVALNALGLIPGGRGVVSLTRWGKGLGTLGKALTTPGGFRTLASAGAKYGRNVVTAVPHALSMTNGIRGAIRFPKLAARSFVNRFLGRDPIDMVSGEMVMQMTDFELPALLPVVLERTYASSYGVGRWFGPSWSSFLDQRLEVDGQGICFAYTEAVLLTYPLLAPGQSALPDEGPRLRLSRRADGSYRITEPKTGRSFWFAPPPKEPFAGAPGVVLPLAGVSDRNGNRIDIGYDPVTGWPAQIDHTGGYQVQIECQAGQITEFRLTGQAGEPDSSMVRYAYDEHGRLSDVINSSGLPLKFGYDRYNRITSWTDRNGTWYRYAYDGEGRVVRTSGSAHCLDGEMRYDIENRVTVEVNSQGAETAYHYNRDGQVERVVDPSGNATVTAWDRYHRKTSETDALGRATRWAYDEQDNLVRVTRPDGGEFAVEYGADHQPTRVWQPDGSLWRQEFDERGNVTALIDPAGAVTRYGYDEKGALRRRTDPRGHTTRLETDRAGLTLGETDPLGNTSRVERDSFGRIRSVTDALGRTTGYAWTVEGLPTRQTLPDGETQTWRYDAEGNLAEQIDSAGRSTVLEHTYFDLPAVQTDPAGGRTAYTYDTELRLTSVTDPRGLVWRYEYDVAGRLQRETDYDGRTVSYRHDAAGQLVERINGAGEKIRFAYDALGSVVTRHSADGVTAFTHDEMGRLVRATNPDTDLELRRDLLGRVIEESVDGLRVASHFDQAGNRLLRRTPTGLESLWEYDALNRPSGLRVAGETLSFTHDAVGNEVERAFAGGRLRQTWSSGRQLLSQAIHHPGPAAVPAVPLQHRSFGYDGAGHLRQVDDRLRGRRRLELDALDRVTDLRAEGGQHERYRYDGSSSLAGDPAPWLFQGSRVTVAGRNRYEYDAQGRLTRRLRRTLDGRRQEWQFTWNAEDRLTSVVTPAGDRWRYVYDALGRRVRKERLSGGPVVVRFAWDGINLAEAVEVTDGRVVEVLSWDWEAEQAFPLTQVQRTGSVRGPKGDDQAWYDQRFYAIVADLAGSPSELVTPDGELIPVGQGNLWGAGGGDGPHDCPFAFPGQYRDPESELHYNFYRYYEPDTGSYISVDPIHLSGGINPRGYVSNPFAWIDPLGLSPYPPIGFAPGEGHTVLTPNRIQHGTKHLIKKGLLSPWSGKKSPDEIRNALVPILENPRATFDHQLGEDLVKGFLGEIKQSQVAVFVYKGGPFQGQLASSSVPTPNQLAKWGLS